MSNKQKAAEIQKFLDWEYNIDIASFQTSELRRLALEINRFLELEVDTDDLTPAEDFLQESEDFGEVESLDEDEEGDYDDIDEDDEEFEDEDEEDKLQ